MKKTILITGSTDGIGKMAAMKFAHQGHTVYVHGRSQEKLEQCISEIKEASKNSEVRGFIADFGDFDSIQKIADEIKQETTKIDILINNAGVFNSPLKETKDGLDIRYMVNYFAPYILTNELLPLFENGKAQRIINVSSAAQASVDHRILSGGMKVSEREAYAQSKLALTMWSFDLAKRLSNIQVIAVNPGSLLNTKMAIEAFGNFWSPADKGADILFDLALSDRYNEKTGVYFDNDREAFGPAHPDAYDAQRISSLLKATEELVDRFSAS